MCGTEIGYQVLLLGRVIYCTGAHPRLGPLSPYTCATRCPVLVWRMVLLRACYAMSGSEKAYGATSRRVRYAMSGTGSVAYDVVALRA
eukprot:1820093-Rhodomonas_salina.2